jgi:hypothetical protein
VQATWITACVGFRGQGVRPSRGVPASPSASVVAVFADLQNKQRQPIDHPRSVPWGTSGARVGVASVLTAHPAVPAARSHRPVLARRSARGARDTPRRCGSAPRRRRAAPPAHRSPPRQGQELGPAGHREPIRGHHSTSGQPETCGRSPGSRRWDRDTRRAVATLSGRETGRQHIHTAQRGVSAFAATPSDERLIRQQMRLKGARVDHLHSTDPPPRSMIRASVPARVPVTAQGPPHWAHPVRWCCVSDALW